MNKLQISAFATAAIITSSVNSPAIAEPELTDGLVKSISGLL